MKKLGLTILTGVILLLIGGVVWRIVGDDGGPGGRPERGPAPVEVAPIEKTSITQKQTFSASMESPSRFMAASKVSGRVAKLMVHVGDTVGHGAVVAKIDDAEFVQALKQAEAEHAVAEAQLREAEVDLEVAKRALERTKTLRERGVSSAAELESAEANVNASRAQRAVAEAQIQRAAAALEEARIRLGYTSVKVEWDAKDPERTVATRLVNEGQTVGANESLFEIVDLDPILAVIYVTERDYGRLEVGQATTLETDAFPGRTFEGEVTRVAPVFSESSRQARIEVTFPNGDHRLKPGMFARVTVALETANEATVVPFAALTRRDDELGVFILSETDSDTVSWHPVSTGIRARDRIQLLEENLSGRVVTLGQQLVEDGSQVSIPETSDAPEAQ